MHIHYITYITLSCSMIKRVTFSDSITDVGNIFQSLEKKRNVDNN